MDYGKSGNAKADKNTPRNATVSTRGAPQPAGGMRENKAEILARMKAAAEAKKAASAAPKG